MKRNQQTTGGRLALLKQKIERGDPVDSRLYCRFMLERVSRTFALTIKTLGFPFREPVLMGYLFCRIADTYEDSPRLKPWKKARLLDTYYALVEVDGRDERGMMRLKSLGEFCVPENDEEFLAKHLDVVFDAYRRLPARTRAIIRKTVLEMVGGMKETVLKHSVAGRRLGTDSEDDLDRYCYYVAGTVGHMLTDLFREHSPWIGRKRYIKLSIDKEAFGAGLQLTNIIKDAFVDLRRGVSFIPRDLAAKHDVPLEKIHAREYRLRAGAVMNELIVKAAANLNLALRYAIYIPKTEPRIRLFCLLPVFLAMRTLLCAAEDGGALREDEPVKISRAQVKRTVRSVFLMCLWDFMIVREYKRLLRRLEVRVGVEIPLSLRTLRFLPVATA